MSSPASPSANDAGVVKYLAAMLFVELDDASRWQAESQRYGNDTAGRCTDNEVKMIYKVLAKRFLERREDRRAERTADSATI